MKILTCLAASLFLSTLLWAAPKTTDTVKLKDGTTLEGKVVSETAESVIIQVAVGKGIMDEKTIPAASVASIEKAPPEALAFERLGKIIPTSDLLSSQEYDELIATKIEPFLKNYGKTALAAEVRKLADTLHEEKERVSKGDIKLGGQWIAAADYEKEKVWIDGQITLRRMQLATTARRYGDALRLFDEIDKTWPGTTVLGNGIQLARKALASYKAELAEVLAILPALEKQRKERLLALTPEDRTQSEAAWQKEREAIKLKIAEETKAGTKWVTVDRSIEDSVKKMVAAIEKEDARLAAIPTTNFIENESALKDTEKAIAEGRLDEALQLITKVKSDAQRMPYFKILSDKQKAEVQRKRTEEIAAKKAERDKTAAREAEERRKKAEEERKEEKENLENARSPISKAVAESGLGKPADKKSGGLSPLLVTVAVVLGGILLALVLSPMLKKKEADTAGHPKGEEKGPQE